MKCRDLLSLIPFHLRPVFEGTEEKLKAENEAEVTREVGPLLKRLNKQ